ETSVRVDAAAAIAQLGLRDGVPVLRLKALVGDAKPEVVGQCFYSLLILDPQVSVRFINGFLAGNDDAVRGEAAGALAQSKEPEALECLKKLWKERLSTDLRLALVISLASSPLADAAEFLLSIAADSSV